MEQLTGRESLFLELDADGAPMHVSSVAIYDRGSAPRGAAQYADILRYFSERVHRSGIFRRRVVTLPLSLARPYWIADPGFDLEYHVRHIALPKPGGWRELCDQVARLHARPLDRSRPLWECYIIEELDQVPGVPRGSFAVYLKIHLAAMGGAPDTQLFAALHELAPDSKASPPKKRPYFDREPTLLDLAVRAAADTATRPLRLARYAAGRAGALLTFGVNELSALTRHVTGRAEETLATRELAAPRTRFNAKVSGHRAVDGVRFDLAPIERMRDTVHGATVNDVAIAIVAGGLRRYLDSRLELPQACLVADAPLTSRSETRVYASPAFADTALLPLYTDIDDPRERLQRIVAETRARKAMFQAYLGRQLLEDTVELVPTLLLGVGGDLARRLRLACRLAPLANATITATRGPDVPVYLAGARLIAYYGLGPVHDLAGLAHVIGYYDGALTIGVTACRSMLPDPAHYAQCLQAAHDELGHALGVLPPPHDHHVSVASRRALARWGRLPGARERGSGDETPRPGAA